MNTAKRPLTPAIPAGTRFTDPELRMKTELTCMVGCVLRWFTSLRPSSNGARRRATLLMETDASNCSRNCYYLDSMDWWYHASLFTQPQLGGW